MFVKKDFELPFNSRKAIIKIIIVIVIVFIIIIVIVLIIIMITGSTAPPFPPARTPLLSELFREELPQVWL